MDRKYTDFIAYIEKAKKSIFRYEGLQDYSGEDGEEWVKEYLVTGKFKIQPEETDWWKYIKTKNDEGIKTCRVRRVVEPLTDYTNVELVWLKEAAGYSKEDIRVVGESETDKIESGLKDFYLIDDQYLFTMEYGTKGKFVGSILCDQKELQKYIGIKEKLIENSIDVGKYLS